MRKNLIRFVVFLLVPSLLVDPVLASALNTPLSPRGWERVGVRGAIAAQFRFEEEALAATLLSHPILHKRMKYLGRLLKSIVQGGKQAWEKSIRDALNDFDRIEAQLVDTPSDDGSAKYRLVPLLSRLGRTLLSSPKPAKTKDEVWKILTDIHRRATPLLSNIGNGFAETLNQPDDWLVYAMTPQVRDTETLKKRAKTLAIYSPRGSALLFGMLGPHLRRMFEQTDDVDLEMMPILMSGFLPHIKSLLGEVQEARAMGVPDIRKEEEAAQYTGLLINGLMIVPRDVGQYPEFFRELMRRVKSYGVSGSPTIISSALATFPYRFPPDVMPTYLLYEFGVFGDQEIESLADENARRPEKERGSFWEAFSNTSRAAWYHDFSKRHWIDAGNHEPSRSFSRPEDLEKVYAFLQHFDRAMLKDGTENLGKAITVVSAIIATLASLFSLLDKSDVSPLSHLFLVTAAFSSLATLATFLFHSVLYIKKRGAHEFRWRLDTKLDAFFSLLFGFAVAGHFVIWGILAEFFAFAVYSHWGYPSANRHSLGMDLLSVSLFLLVLHGIYQLSRFLDEKWGAGNGDGEGSDKNESSVSPPAAPLPNTPQGSGTITADTDAAQAALDPITDPGMMAAEITMAYDQDRLRPADPDGLVLQLLDFWVGQAEERAEFLYQLWGRKAELIRVTLVNVLKEWQTRHTDNLVTPEIIDALTHKPAAAPDNSNTEKHYRPGISADLLSQAAQSGLGESPARERKYHGNYERSGSALDKDSPNLIDLNQSDLSTLRVQLRQTFSKSLLSDGAVKGIVAWRQQHGPFCTLEQLESIRGVGKSTVVVMRSNLKRFFDPLPQPARLILSGHHEANEGEWVRGEMARLAGSIETNRPIVVWIENAAPLDFPDKFTEFEKRYETARLELGAPAIDWIEQLSKPVMDDMSRRILEKWWKLAHDEENRISPERFLDVDSNSAFFSPVRQGIKDLRHVGHPVEIRLEHAILDSTILSWHHELAPRLAVEAFRRWDLVKAIACIDKEIGYFIQMLHARDSGTQGFSAQVAEGISKKPEALHMIIRGAAHAVTVKNELEERQIGYLSNVMDNDLAKAVALEKKSPKTRQGTSEQLAQGDLFFRVLWEFAGIESIDDEMASRVGHFVELIPDRMIQEWFKEYGGLEGATFDEAIRASLEWFGYHLVGDAEALDLIATILHARERVVHMTQLACAA